MEQNIAFLSFHCFIDVVIVVEVVVVVLFAAESV
jgi:hypothetical protein